MRCADTCGIMCKSRALCAGSPYETGKARTIRVHWKAEFFLRFPGRECQVVPTGLLAVQPDTLRLATLRGYERRYDPRRYAATLDAGTRDVTRPSSTLQPATLRGYAQHYDSGVLRRLPRAPLGEGALRWLPRA